MKITLPNPWFVAIIAAILGSLTGSGTALLRATTTPLRTGAFATRSANSSGPRPVAQISETTYNFGRVSLGGTGSHAFVVRNVGTAPLLITKGTTSCTCTVSDFEGEGEGKNSRTISAGDEITVRIEWTGKGEGGPFRQRATILTNDPNQPEIAFSIEGTVIPTWKAEPNGIVVSGISANAASQAEVKIYTFSDQLPRLSNCRIADDSFADRIVVENRPLTQDELQEEPEAKGGFFLSLDIASGLPLGKIRTSVEASFSLGEEKITAVVPIEGIVSGDLMLVGRKWDRNSNALRLGTVSDQTGLTTKIFLTAKGEFRNKVQPRVVDIVPEGLTVKIDPPSQIGGGDIVRIGIEIQIPPGTPPANNLCSETAEPGYILLETGHPKTPTLKIPVCVAIAE
ncbi:MAG: DUF1573 domain-containing protein [Pirellulales bacterium]|nr:DUF1573 domain-containing protein [Pirellulales bacterium]